MTRCILTIQYRCVLSSAKRKILTVFSNSLGPRTLLVQYVLTCCFVGHCRLKKNIPITCDVCTCILCLCGLSFDEDTCPNILTIIPRFGGE